MTSPLFQQLTPSTPAASDLFDFSASANDVFPPGHPTRALLERTWCDVPLVYASYNENYGTLLVGAEGLYARLAVTDASSARTVCDMTNEGDPRVSAFESGGVLVLLAIGDADRRVLRVHSALLAPRS
jgi:hypothetical protein